MSSHLEHQDHERHTLAHHISRKLNFNAPLLTTRRSPANVARLSISASGRRSLSTSDRVPFCWEQAPGKPKDYVERCDDDDDRGAATPRPTLPPGWWRPPIQTRRNSRHDHHRNDHSCDDNVENADANNDNSSGSGYVLSETVDVLSLSEAIDIVEKAEKAHKLSHELKLEQLKLYEEEEEKQNDNYNCSSNFMIERFLPDATALAASSVLNRHAFSPQRVARRPVFPPKGCGLDVLIPWRTKNHHQLCGMKSPVKDSSRPLGSKTSAKQKKIHKIN